MSVIRTCDECKNKINIDRSNINDFIYYNKKYYHIDCFVNMCNRKAKNKRYGAKWENVLSNINDIKLSSNKFLKDVLYKDLIYEFIINNYDVNIVPNKVFTKLDAFYTGTFKGMSISMSPEDLYDMWTKKINYLNNLNIKNIKANKIINGADRINYDLSVLLSKYDSYLKWKEKEKIKAEEIKEVCENATNYTSNKSIIANAKVKHQEEEHDIEDIDTILDEIFG